jgi:hypothetical protein
MGLGNTYFLILNIVYSLIPVRNYHRVVLGEHDRSSNSEGVQVMTVGQVILLFTMPHKTT